MDAQFGRPYNLGVPADLYQSAPDFFIFFPCHAIATANVCISKPSFKLAFCLEIH